MNIKDKLDSDWLKININCKEGDHLRFLDEGQDDKNQRGEEVATFLVGIVRDGEVVSQKKFTPNKTNLKIISGLYGMETSKWVKKELQINVVKARNPQTGLPTDSIVLSLPNTDEDGDVQIA